LDSLSEHEKRDDSSIWSTLQAEARKLVQSSSSLENHSGFQAFNLKNASVNDRLTKIMEAASSSIPVGTIII
jgi:hypothetical protein